MAITGGFGTTMDLERGTSRQWVMGRDGVKRWADSGEPVQKPATTLPNDVARCAGVGDDKEGWREGCDDCLRRTAALPKGWASWIEPPAIIAFECEFRIEPPNVVVTGSGFQVAGPGFAGDIYCAEREDAEMIAAALNFAANFREIKRQAEAVKNELEFLMEFK